MCKGFMCQRHLIFTLIKSFSSTSCLARSLHAQPAGGMSESHSQVLEAARPYDAAGVAWVTRVVVTTPVHLSESYLDDC